MSQTKKNKFFFYTSKFFLLAFFILCLCSVTPAFSQNSMNDTFRRINYNQRYQQQKKLDASFEAIDRLIEMQRQKEEEFKYYLSLNTKIDVQGKRTGFFYNTKTNLYDMVNLYYNEMDRPVTTIYLVNDSPYSLQPINIRDLANYNEALDHNRKMRLSSAFLNENLTFNYAQIEPALIKAVEQLKDDLTNKSRIAIIDFKVRDNNVKNYVIGELEHTLREQGYTVLDRANLDVIRDEHLLQMSGEVDENSAVSIGKFAGATVVIIGSIDGDAELRRLRLRALDVESAGVLATASQRF